MALIKRNFSAKAINNSYQNIVKKAVNQDDSSTVEVKYYYTSLKEGAIINSANWASTELDPTTIKCLFCPTQGTTSRDRIGNTVALYSLEIQGCITENIGGDGWGGTTSVDAFKYRVVVLWDRQCNGNEPSFEDVFYTDSSALTNYVDAPQSYSSFGKIGIVADLTMCFNKKATCRTYGSAPKVTMAGSVQSFKICLDFSENPILVHFKSSAGTVDDVVDNNFFIGANISGDNTPALQLSCLYYCSRAKFVNVS